MRVRKTVIVRVRRDRLSESKRILYYVEKEEADLVRVRGD